MLDEKDLQAIAQLLAQQEERLMGEMDSRFAQQEERLMGEMDRRFAQQKGEIMHEVKLLMEGYFDPKFNYLADGLEMLKERCLSREELEETNDRLEVLEAVVKLHSREIEKLKKAQ